VDLRHSIAGHEVHSAEWAGFKGRKNGELLHVAEGAGYDALLTIDDGLPYQNNFTELRAKTNQLEDLLPLVSRGDPGSACRDSTRRDSTNRVREGV
jgi:hypothetical protein